MRRSSHGGRGDDRNGDGTAAVWELHRRYADDNGDLDARDQLVARYEGLVQRLARRFYRGNEPLDDLVQVAYEALLAALSRFEPERGVPFEAFATRTIAGTLKRHYRDSGWALRVPRAVHEVYQELRATSDDLTQHLGRSPTVPELSDALRMSEELVIEVLTASDARATRSIDAPGPGEVEPMSLRIGSDDVRLDRAEEREALRQTLSVLSDDDRRLLHLYYLEERSQSDIAGVLGVSQMQVSRLLRSAVGRLRSRVPQSS
jgi:RNA polymerase sigma-B factor